MTDPHSDRPSSTGDEPETPVWLPALGFALFVLGGVAWAVTPPAVSATPAPIAAPSVAIPPSPPSAAPQPAPAAPRPVDVPANLPPPAFQRPGGPKLPLPGAPGTMLPRPTKGQP